jgi:dihydroorotate dehydrogenase
MGFNNHGAAAMADQLAALRKTGRWPSHPVGINLGKSKVTPLEDAAADYASSLRALWPHADFFVVNVSSPNTPNLRQLQDKAALAQILAALQKVNLDCAREHSVNDPATAQIRQADPKGPRPKPILVKVAPDLSFEALDEILELVGPHQVAGLVATNTTITRPETRNPAVARAYAEAGGLSGKPLRARSTEVVRHLYSQTRGSVPIIGVGGIFSPDDAWEKIAAGACLVQVYTGFVYMGPGMVRKIVTGLRERLDARGLRHLEDAVGTGR